MNNHLVIQLVTSAAQQASLKALQQAFAEVCNVLAPIARDTRCWNRVALHHMTYHDLRAKFPLVGSQMVCNAIYSVSRTCRLVYQAPNSPFNMARWGEKPLPLIRFAPTSPVYFDRHTLSLKAGHLSMYTLEGRVRFLINLPPADEQRFRSEKLLEIVLNSADDAFSLQFKFGASAAAEGDAAAEPASAGSPGSWPEYVLVLPEVLPEASPLLTGESA